MTSNLKDVLISKRAAFSTQLISSRYEYRNTQIHTHTWPACSSTTPSFLYTVHRCRSGGDADESWRIQSWPDVRAPPIMAASPLTERAIWAAESPWRAHPFLCPALRACSQRDRLGELAGIGAPRSLAKLEHVLIVLAFSEVRIVRDSLYLMHWAGFSHVVWQVTDLYQLLHKRRE